MRFALTNSGLPRWDEYEQAREQADRPASSAAALSDLYGGSTGVHHNTAALLRHAPRTHVPAAKHSHVNRAYNAKDVLDAIDEFERIYGYWPYRGGLIKWGNDSRMVARIGGRDLPIIPHNRVIRTIFGDFAAALEQAQHRAAERERLFQKLRIK